MVRTILQSFVPLRILDSFRAEQSPQEQKPRDTELQERQPLVSGNILHKPSPPLQRPIVCSPEESLIALWKLVAKSDHALNDSCCVSHNGVSALPGRGV